MTPNNFIRKVAIPSYLKSNPNFNKYDLAKLPLGLIEGWLTLYYNLKLNSINMNTYSEVSKEEMDEIRLNTTIINRLKIEVIIANEEFVESPFNKDLIDELTEAWVNSSQFGYVPVGTTFTVDEYDFHGEIFQYDLVQDTDLAYTILKVWVK